MKTLLESGTREGSVKKNTAPEEQGNDNKSTRRSLGGNGAIKRLNEMREQLTKIQGDREQLMKTIRYRNKIREQHNEDDLRQEKEDDTRRPAKTGGSYEAPEQ